MREPNLILNWMAILASVAAAFVFGGIWYGPLFGKPWAKLTGLKMNKPNAKLMMKAYGIQIVGTFLTAFVLAHSSQIWRASVWGVGQDGPDAMYGFYSGFFTWIGFFVPNQLAKMSWENRSWKLFFINAGHDFFTLQVITQILAHWR